MRSPTSPLVAFAIGFCLQIAHAEDRWVGATADESFKLAASRLEAAKRPSEALMAIGLIDSVASSVDPAMLHAWRAPKKFTKLTNDSLAHAILVHDVKRLACRIKHDCGADSAPPSLVLGPIRAGEEPFDPSVPIVLTKSYDFGDYRASWRASPSGVLAPLALMIAPRSESCSWVLRQVQLEHAANNVIVALAASGQATLFVDGQEVSRDEEAHEEALATRFAASMTFEPGAHQLLAKVCTTTRIDAGIVELDLLDNEKAPSGFRWIDPMQAPSVVPPRAGSKINRSMLPINEAMKKEGHVEALLRILLGADDSQHPRAPGLAATALESPGHLTLEERIVLATHVSSPIVRSAWTARLQRDRRLSLPQRTYLQRRAIEQHLVASQVDWAVAEARAASFTKLTDQEARVLRAMAFAATKEVTLQRAAAKELANLDLSDAAAALAVELGPSVDRPLAERALQRVASFAPTPAAVRLSALLDPKQPVALVRKALGVGYLDDEEAMALADCVSELGSTEDIGKLLEEMTALMPNRPKVWSAYARVLDAQHRSDLHKSAMARALALAPADTLLASAKSERPAERDERYLVDPRAWLSTRRGFEAGVASRELFWTRAVTVNDDRRVSQLIHYAREIVIAPRTSDELEEELPFESDTLEILRARVHHKDGSVAFPLEERHDSERPRIKWAELASGDTVEVAVRVRTKKPVGGKSDAPFYFVDYGGSTVTRPLLKNDVIIDAPKSALLHTEVRGSVDERTEQDDGTRHVTRYSWKKPILIAEEPLSPQLSELLPVVVGSTFASWDDFRRWYKDAVVGFTEPDAEIRGLAKVITKGKISKLDQISALFKYVADHVRYVNYVSAEQWLPNRPQEVLSRREGDCDDKAVLLISLLKAIDVDAREVLVQTRLTAKPSVLDGKFAVVPMFDHGIAYIPSLDLYLDATSPQSRLGVLPSMDGQASALRLDDGPAALVKLPESKPGEHGSDVAWRIELTEFGDGVLKANETYSGDSAFYMRTYLGEAAQRADYIAQGLLSPWFPTSQVTGAVAFDGEREKGAATLSYDARLTGVARRQGSVLIVPLGPSNSLVSELAALPTRTLAMVLPPSLAPSLQKRRVTFEAPKGKEWSAIPSGGGIVHPLFGRASLSLKVSGRELMMARELELRRDQIPVKEYAAWRAWLAQVDALFLRTAQLVQEGAR